VRNPGYAQWRGNYFWTGGQDQERQSREREIKVFAGIRAFFDPKRSVLHKKKVYAGQGASSCSELKRSPKKNKVFPGFGRIFAPKMTLRGAKVAQEGQNISRGGRFPPCPPTSRAYATPLMLTYQ